MRKEVIRVRNKIKYPHVRRFSCDDSLNKNVADELAQMRKSLNVSQTQLAQRMGIAQSTVAAIETARDNISLTKLVRYAEALGAEISLKVPPKNGRYIYYQTLASLAHLVLQLARVAMKRGTSVALNSPEVSNETTDDSQVRTDPQAAAANEDGPQDDSESARQESSLLPELPLSA
jgi:transcriptional regulator with XRE-family HTH domain